jgi:predicted transposase YdaD
VATRKKPRPFDAALKKIADLDPAALARLVGEDATDIEVLNSDLSTKLAADRVLLVRTKNYILLIELQAQRDPKLVARLRAYSGLLTLAYGLPVRKVVILLCKAADHASLTGEYRDRWDNCTYEVLRLWEISPAIFFSGVTSLLAFAPLCDVSEEELPALIGRMTVEIGANYDVPMQKEIWACANVLMGLKFRPHVANEILIGVFNMLDLSTSTTYQELVKDAKAEGEARGRSTEARRILLKLGAERLGEPGEQTQEVLKAIKSHERLEDLLARLFHVETWQDLLA